MSSQKSSLETAFQYAFSAQFEDLQKLITSNPELLKSQLSILDNIPETVSPLNYQFLLPKATQEQKTEVFRNWLIKRTKYIEKVSGQIDNSLSLIELCKNNGILGLEDIHKTFQLLNILVYEFGLEMDFEKLSSLSEYKRFALLMKNVSENVIDFLKRVITIIPEILEKRDKKQSILHEYLVDSARSGNLKLCEQIIFESRPILPTSDRIIKNNSDLIEIALDCVYAYKRVDQWDVMHHIFECLPIEEPSTLIPLNEMAKFTKLNERVETFDKHLAACELLSNYSLAPPLSFFLNVNERQEDARTLLHKMCHHCSQIKPPLSTETWRDLLSDLLTLYEKVFPFISSTECYTLFVSTVLKNGQIQLAKEFLPSTKKQSEQLILEAAKEFFNSAISLGDPLLKTALEILAISSSKSPDIIEEQNLIKACMLLNKYNVTSVPLQVRLSKDRMEFIVKALENSPIAYRDVNSVIHLASLLMETPSSVISKIRVQVAQTALEHEDFETAFQICKSLIESSYKNIWKVCRDLAFSKKFGNSKQKLEMLSFVITHCPMKELDDVLKLQKELELQLIYDQFGIETSNQTIETLLKFKEVVSKTNQTTPNSQQFNFVFPSFYNEAFANEEEENINSTNEIPKLYEINQSILRLHVLYQSAVVLQDDLLLELGEQFMTLDTPLSFSYLLSLNDPSLISKIFDKLLNNFNEKPIVLEKIIQYSCYFLAIKELTLFYANSKPELIETLYIGKPDDIIQQAIETFDPKNQQNLSNSDIQALHQLLLRYYYLLRDSAKIKSLTSFDVVVDVKKFVHDPNYRKDILFVLCRSSNPKSIETAIHLAEQYHLSIWDILKEHIEWIFINFEGPFEDFNKLIRNQIPNLLSYPQETIQLLESRIYGKINGTKLNSLSMYYEVIYQSYKTLVEKGVEDKEKYSTILEDIEKKRSLLESFSKVRPLIDFKKFTDDSSVASSLILEILNEENVTQLVKITKTLPNIDLKEMDLYNFLISKILSRSNQDINQKFFLCEQVLRKLDPPSLSQFMEEFCISQTSIENYPISIRINAINKIVEIAENLNNSKKNITINIDKFKQIQHHLTWIKKFYNLEGLGINLTKQIDKTLSNPENLQTVLLGLIGIGYPPSLIEDILVESEILVQKKTTNKKLCELYEGAITTLLSRLDSMKEENFEEKEKEETKINEDLQNWVPKCSNQIFSYLKKILDSIITEEHSDLETIAYSCFRAFSSNSSHNLYSRIKVLELIREKVSSDDKLLEELNVQYLMKDAFNENVKEEVEETSSVEQQKTTFTNLLNSATSFKQIHHLYSLLKIWHERQLVEISNMDKSSKSFVIEAFRTCWFELFSKIIEKKELNLLILIRQEMQRRFLIQSDEELDLMKTKFQESDWLTKFKFGLLSPYEHVIHETITMILEHEKEVINSSNTADPTKQVDTLFLQLVAETGKLLDFVSSRYFVKIIHYIITLHQNNEEEINNKEEKEVVEVEKRGSGFKSIRRQQLSIAFIVATLVISHFHSHAAYVVSKLQFLSSSSTLYNLDTSFSLLQQFLVHYSNDKNQPFQSISQKAFEIFKKDFSNIE